MVRETPEEAELRRARRRERDRHNRRLEQAEIRRATRRQRYNHRRDDLTTEQHQDILQQRRILYNTNAQDCDAEPCRQSNGTTEVVDHGISAANTARFDEPRVIIKMSEFHEHMDSLHCMKCEVCQERFPNLQVNGQQRCKQYASDKHEPQLFSTQNNMNPGVLPPELTVSYMFIDVC